MDRARFFSFSLRTLFALLLILQASVATAGPDDNAFDCLLQVGDTQRSCSVAGDSCKRQCVDVQPPTLPAYEACLSACKSQTIGCQNNAFGIFDMCFVAAPVAAIPEDNRVQIYFACSSMCFAESTFCQSLGEMTFEECIGTQIECNMVCEFNLGPNPPF